MNFTLAVYVVVTVTAAVVSRYFNRGGTPAIKSAFVLCCLICCACSRSGQSSANIFPVDIHTQAPLSDFIGGYDGCLVLETPEEGLLETVTKIRIENDTLYVLDGPRQAIHFFNCNTGVWLGKIAKTGRGPGEYLDLWDFDVRNSRIYALSFAGRKINVYAPSGELLSEIKLEYGYTKLSVLDEHAIWLYSEKSNNGSYNYVLYDPSSGEIKAKFDPFPENESYSRSGISPFCCRSADTLFVAKFFDNNVYCLTEESYGPVFRFDFNTKYKITQRDLQRKTGQELSGDFKWKEVLRRICHIGKTGGAVYVVAECFFDGLAVRQCLLKVDMENRHVAFYRLGDAIDPDYPFISASRVLGFDAGRVISIGNALSVQRLAKEHNIPGFDGIHEGQNPILFFYRLKK